jgi:hypothetical protein
MGLWDSTVDLDITSQGFCCVRLRTHAENAKKVVGCVLA